MKILICIVLLFASKVSTYGLIYVNGQEYSIGGSTAAAAASVTNFTEITWTYSDVNVLTNNFPILPSFKAYLGAVQIVTNDEDVLLALDAEVFDNADSFNTNLSRFVIPVSGIYHFDAKAATATMLNGKYLTVRIRTNGSVMAEGVRLASGATDDYHTMASGLVNETNGAIIDVVVHHDYATVSLPGISNNQWATFFQGHFVSP